jgi:hypothetical protein
LISFGVDGFLSRYQREDAENAAAGRELLNLVAGTLGTTSFFTGQNTDKRRDGLVSMWCWKPT